MQFCTKCGEGVEPGDKFCLNCGSPIREEVANSAQSEPLVSEASSRVQSAPSTSTPVGTVRGPRFLSH